jgi:IS30 family transposase
MAVRAVAEIFGVHCSTVSREPNRNVTVIGYSPSAAQHLVKLVNGLLKNLTNAVV